VLLPLGPLSNHLPHDGLKDQGNVERVEGRALNEVEAMPFGEVQGLVFSDLPLGCQVAFVSYQNDRRLGVAVPASPQHYFSISYSQKATLLSDSRAVRSKTMRIPCAPLSERELLVVIRSDCAKALLPGRVPDLQLALLPIHQLRLGLLIEALATKSTPIVL